MNTMVWIIECKRLHGCVLELHFNDGSVRVVDLSAFLDGPIYEPLHDQGVFDQVRLNEDTGTIEWPNGADFAPEFLYSIPHPTRRPA